jgi:large subunit ribosomal protein L18
VAHIYAQVIDDSKGQTMVAASSVEKAAKTNGGNVAAAKAIGKAIAQRAQEKGIKQVVFDRGGYQYHGRVKALAEAAREAGLEF